MSWLKAGVSSKQFWNSDTRAKMYRPSLALDMATTRRLTSLWRKKEEKVGNWCDTSRGEKSKRSSKGGRSKCEIVRGEEICKGGGTEVTG